MSETTPDDTQASVPTCEHHYASHKGAYSPLWVRVCQLCGEIDWGDLKAQVKAREAALTADRDRLRTAWMSARRRAVDARENEAMERFFARETGADVVKLRRQVKEDNDWHEAYNQLCSDLAYTLGMEDASLAGDHQVKARVRQLVADRDAAYERGAKDMRDRAADTVARYWPRLTDKRPAAEKCADVMDSIRALPLLPDDDEGEPCRSFTADPSHPGVDVYCEHTGGDGHSGLHHAHTAGLTWGDAAPSPDLTSRVTALEADNAALRVDMRQAQAALRGLGATSPPVDPCDTTGVHGPHQWDHTDGPRRCMGAY